MNKDGLQEKVKEVERGKSGFIQEKKRQRLSEKMKEAGGREIGRKGCRDMQMERKNIVNSTLQMKDL